MTTPRSTRRRKITAPDGTAVGYLRVSTDEQVVSGLGLEAQRAAIEEAATRKGWTVVEWHIEGAVSGKVQVLDRPVFPLALQALHEGRAQRVMVARLDRLGRDAGDVLNLDRDYPGAIYMCDRDLDTANSNDRLQLGVMAVVAENERAKISERTKAALAVKKAQGVRLGRPSALPTEVVARIVQAHADGYGYSAIARQLEADQVPTARGGASWYPRTVQKVLEGQDAERIRAELAPAV